MNFWDEVNVHVLVTFHILHCSNCLFCFAIGPLSFSCIGLRLLLTDVHVQFFIILLGYYIGGTA